MSLPDDTPLSQMVDDLHLDPAAVAALPPAAQQITKGQLVALWGATDATGAVQNYQSANGTWTPSAAGGDAPLTLTISDVKAVQALFEPAGAKIAGATDEMTINCCCCPCCCATAVLEPAAPVA